MSTPQYKGPGQPTPDASAGLSGWFGGFLGGATAPAYKTAPPPCKVADPAKAPAAQRGDARDPAPVPVALDEYGDAVIPVGPGPITIVINPRG